MLNIGITTPLALFSMDRVESQIRRTASGTGCTSASHAIGEQWLAESLG